MGRPDLNMVSHAELSIMAMAASEDLQNMEAKQINGLWNCVCYIFLINLLHCTFVYLLNCIFLYLYLIDKSQEEREREDREIEDRRERERERRETMASWEISNVKKYNFIR